MASLSFCRASVSQTLLFNYICNVQWSQSCGARCWTYVGTKAATFWHISGMSTIAYPILNRDDDLSASARLAMEVEARQPCVLPVNELVFADDTLVVAAGPCRAETQLRCIEVMICPSPHLEEIRGTELPCEAFIAARDASFLTPSHTWGVIWMLLALLARNFADDWVSYVPSLCCVNVAILSAHNVVEDGELRKSDGFQANCFRSMIRIPPLYISRISYMQHCYREAAANR